MYNSYQTYLCPYCINTAQYSSSTTQQNDYNNMYRCPYFNSRMAPPNTQLKDYGPEPFVINIEEATKQNNAFRVALWTGEHLQLTLMSINVGEDIGLEMHPDVDQFIRIEEGQAIVRMGDNKENLDFQRNISDDFVALIPAGKWHNIINTGNKPLKLYSIYAPPQHPKGTIHQTKAIAEAAEKKY